MTLWDWVVIALYLGGLMVVLMVSYSTAPPCPERIKGLTYASIDKKTVRASWNRLDVIATVAVVTLIVGMYLYFSFWL
jgi:SSS family solute:Na+ symporter